MMSLTFGLFNQVSGLGPLGPLVFFSVLMYSFLFIFPLCSVRHSLLLYSGKV